MNFSNLSLPLNITIFIVAAIVVWIAGTKIAAYADELAERFRISRALMGFLLLAGVTSLPEIATSFTAAIHDNTDLAINNLLGSISMQIAVLAVADVIYGKRALTSVVPDPVVILQGALNVCLLALVAIAIVVSDVAFLGAGAWTWALFALAIFSVKKITEADNKRPWVVNPDDKEVAEQAPPEPNRRLAKDSHTVLISKTVIAALAILIAGFVVATVGDVIAQQSGLGSSFMGVAFVAIATSLPEASTVFASIRRGLYTMAISDILGTNILNVALLFGVDVIASGEPVLTRVGDFATLGALLGVTVTGIFLVGLAERNDRTIARMGPDSLAVLVVYFGGLVLLYFTRG